MTVGILRLRPAEPGTGAARSHDNPRNIPLSNLRDSMRDNPQDNLDINPYGKMCNTGSSGGRP